jgi:heme exporter protein CcmD
MLIQHLLEMGGYGAFVWPAYAITLFVFGINLVLFSHEKKQVKKIITQLNKTL